ncbi:MAG: DUF3418 domain-containing protein, partial [Phycisphaerae bacterium]|nr:DUF3418 domain-containing protein [Phycisphaerae bacterium]
NAPPVWRDAADDLWARLGHLVPLDVLTRQSPYHDADLPRYLRALQVRTRKLSGGGLARDRANQTQVARWDEELARAEAAMVAEGNDPELLASFRRLLEEFHVSLFAQEVRTALPMSAQRLERAWRERHEHRGNVG